MNTRQLHTSAGFLLLMFWSLLSWAAATVTAVGGNVEFTPASGAAGKLATGQRVETGAMLKSGDDGSAVLRFDDGQSLSLRGNTTFIVNDYKFNPHKPEESNFAATLLRGAVRAVTGIIGETNKQNVKIKTPTATMGIRGTDFMLNFDGRLYIQVLSGAVSATNDAGVAVFDATTQPLGVVASSSTLGQPIKPTDLPAAMQSSFRQMSVVPLSGKEREPNPNDPTCRDRR